MESKFVFAANGVEVEQGDISSISVNAALADDRVFQELFRMAPYTGSTPVRGITPPGNLTTLNNNSALAIPNGATGQVSVPPFRAFLGPFANDTPTHSLRDTRSCVATGTNTLAQIVQLANNASGAVQFDLVYAIISVDAAAVTLTRYVKNVIPPYNVGAQSLVTQVQTSVSLAVQPGTGGTYPAAPSDTATNYCVPLFYVRKPIGFNASSTVAKTDIQDVAPVLHIAGSSGAAAQVPASSQNSLGAGGGKWSSGGGRGETFMSPLQIGGENLIIKLSLIGPSTNWSLQSGDVVDNSINWLDRDFLWFAASTQGDDFASNAGGSTSLRLPNASPLIAQLNAGSDCKQFGFGQSYVNDGTTLLSGGSPPNSPIPLALTSNSGGNATNAFGGANATVALYVDSSGVLRLFVNGTPSVKLQIHLIATAQFPNY